MAGDPSFFLSPEVPPHAPPTERPDGAPPVEGPGEDGAGGDAAGGGARAPVERSGRGRRRLAGALVVAAGLAVALVADRGGGDGDGGAAVAPVTTAAPDGSGGDGAPGGPERVGPGVLTTTAQLGPLLPEPTGTTLALVGAGRFVLAHLDTGTVRTADIRPTEERWATPPLQAVVPFGDDLLVAGSRAKLVPRAGGEVRDLGRVGGSSALGFLPSAVPGRWWSYDHRFDIELVEHGPDGATGRRVRVPGEANPVLPVGDGFLVSLLGTVLRVDATTGEATTIGSGVALAADERTLVLASCDDTLVCGLRITDLAGGAARVVPALEPGRRYATHGGAVLSPDGRWLAVPTNLESWPDRVALIDVAHGVHRPFDGDGHGIGGLRSATFTADSRWLLLTDAAAGRIQAVRTADGTVVEVDLGVGSLPERGSRSVVALPSIAADADADP